LNGVNSLQLHYNARYENGNTVFYILFDTLMQANPQNFNKLLGHFLGHPLKTNTINLSLKNKDGQTIHSLPYLNADQINCLHIAEQIQQAQKLYIELNPIQDQDESEGEGEENLLSIKEKEELTVSLRNKMHTISVALEKLPRDNESMLLLYFNILILHTTQTNNIVELSKTAIPWIKGIEQTINSKKGLDLWNTLNDIILYVLPTDDIHFSDQLQSLYMNMVTKLLINSKQPETLQFTQEQWITHQIVNPYKAACDHQSKYTLPIIHLLMQHDVSPDVIINTNDNSLLHALFSFTKNMQTEEWTSIMNLLMDKLDQCPTTLALPNATGNTPLHLAILTKIRTPYIDSLINAMVRNKCSIDTLNHAGMSPFYLAIKPSTLSVAHALLQRENISVLLKPIQQIKSPNTTPGSLPSISFISSAFLLWNQQCTNLRVLRPTLTEQQKTTLRYAICASLNFAITLLQKGCHYFTKKDARDKINLISIRNHINQCGNASAILWDKENVDPFIEFNKKLDNLSTGWHMVEHIESGCSIIPYSQLYPFINIGNTRRFSDDKTMFEIILKTKNTLVTELEKIVDLSDDNNSTKKLQQKIAALNIILSSLILDGLNIQESIADDTFKNCADISQKIAKLKHEQNKWLQAQAQPKQENKENEETKGNNDIVPNLEISLTHMGKEIFTDLNNFESNGAYSLFRARSYFKIAQTLFCVDNKFKNLQISQATLALVNDNLKQAMQLSRCFAVEDMSFRDPIVALKAIVSPYLPDSTGYHKLHSTLERLIPHVEELKLRKKERHTFSEIDDLLSVHAEGTLNFSTGIPSICNAIPAALVRSNKLIETLKENLEKEKKEKMEALAREQLLQEKIAHLEQQLLATIQKNAEKVASEPPAAVEQPAPTFLPTSPIQSKKRVEEAVDEEQESNTHTHQTEKRQKTTS